MKYRGITIQPDDFDDFAFDDVFDATPFDVFNAANPDPRFRCLIGGVVFRGSLAELRATIDVKLGPEVVLGAKTNGTRPPAST